MAQLNSLIVTGPSRFLNKIYAKELQVSDSFITESPIDVGHSTPVNALIYLNGKKAFDGHDSWLRINETKAFTNGVYFGSSLIRTDAGIQVLSNGTALNATGTSFKVGVPATFADLNADYVYANTLSTSHFDLQEINQLGDNSTFYVAPSIKFPASTTTQVVITKNTSNVTIAITDSSITSTTIAGAVWTVGSKVKASGTLDGVVTGTMDGTITGLNTSSHVLTIQVSGSNWAALTTKTITNNNLINNFNVMMYERYADSKYYPVGIMLTSYGGANKLTYLDIFAGTSGNDTLPNVRLGNLSSIGTITYATGVTATPSGYGLYADNVYLKGVVVANSGMIGGFQIASNSIHTANVAITSNADNSLGLSSVNFTRTVAGESHTNLRFALGKNFGVSNTGEIFTSAGKIAGWTVSGSALYKNTDSMTSTTAGIYLGTDGIRNYKDADTFVDIKDGVITAKAVDLTGKITATSGDIGSIHIGTSSLYSGSHTAYNSNVAGFYLGSDGKFGIGNNSSYLRYDGTNVSLSVQSLSIGGVSAATEDSVKAATETIIGTQTAATGSWTGKSDYISALSDGLQIKYWLPYAGSGNATLNLTLSGGGTTGAIAIYRQGGTYNTTSKAVVANRVTTHFPAGSMINMTYGVNRTVAVVYSGTTYTGTFTGWFADGAYDSGNTINRTRFESAIKAVTAITAGHIICGNSSGYKNIAKGLAFDLSYPLLYARSAINANATGTNNDTLASNINFSTSLAITSGAANKELYLMGDVDGSTFTIDSSTPLTTVVPSSANSKYYIPLGVMSSATYGTFVSSNRLYAYVNGSFQAVDVAAQVTADNTLILETPYTYSDDNVVFTAVLYRGGEDVSTEYLSDCYKWYKKTEDGLTQLSVGYTFTINKSELEYGGSIVCRFNSDTTVAALSTPSNSVLTDINGSYLTTYISTDEFLANLGDPATTNVAGLPTKTAANITGSLLGTTTDAAYRIDYNELAKAIIENYDSSSLRGSNQSIKSAIDNLAQWKVYYGTCTTAAGTRTKTVTVSADQNFSLRVGAIVGVKFSNTNTYSNVTSSPITLNVNSTGAKNIWYNTTHSGAGNTGTLTTPYGVAKRYNYYMYDGTYWVWVSHGFDENNTYTAASAAPLMDGTAAVGTSAKYAREDHVHPSDTSKVDKDLIASYVATTARDSIGDVLGGLKMVDYDANLIDTGGNWVMRNSIHDRSDSLSTAIIRAYGQSGNLWQLYSHAFLDVAQIQIAVLYWTNDNVIAIRTKNWWTTNGWNDWQFINAKRRNWTDASITYSSYVTDHQLQMELRGETVFLCGYIQTAANTPVNTTLFTLPDGFRPVAQWTMLGQQTSGTDINKCRNFLINTNGTVVVHNGSALANTYFRLSVAFPVNAR